MRVRSTPSLYIDTIDNIDDLNGLILLAHVHPLSIAKINILSSTYFHLSFLKTDISLSMFLYKLRCMTAPVSVNSRLTGLEF